MAVQQIDVIATLLAPGSEQRVSMLMQRLRIEDHRHSGLARLAFVLVTQQVFVGDDISPVMATRVVNAEQNLAELRQARQCLERLCGQRGNAKNDDTCRQTRRRFGHAADALDEALMYTRSTLRHTFGTDIIQQRAPQLGLPAISG